MNDDVQMDFRRLPGLFRLWDLPFVISPADDYRVHYAERTEDGASLFMVYRRDDAGETME